MQQLPTHLLVEAYETAIKLQLDPNFIDLLELEMVRRGVYIVEKKATQ